MFPFPMLHLALAAPAKAGLDLLVGQDGPAMRAPVHRSPFPISEPAFVHEQKEPLRPAIVVRRAGVDLLVPVVADSKPLLLPLHLLHALLRPLIRADAIADRRIFRRQAEGIPAHGMDHVVAAHPQKTGENITNGVDPHMAHMQLSRGIGKHLQHIVLRPGEIHRSAIRLLCSPTPLPFGLNCLGIITFHPLDLPPAF